MIHIRLLMMVMCLATVLNGQQINFATFFEDRTFRIDFYITGNAQSQEVVFDNLRAEGRWAGNPQQLIDETGRGAYRSELVDLASGRLIFACEFVSLFAEYAITPPALNGQIKAVHHSILTPQPKAKVRWILKRRSLENLWMVFHSQELDPASHDVHHEPLPTDVRVVDQLISGDPKNNVDLAWLAEGYTKEQFDQFKADLDRFTEVLFSVDPFRSNKDKFNIRGVFRASQDTGLDDPANGHFARTACHATYRTLGMDHYLGTEANTVYREIASVVPYDAILIMVNDKGYGGNGIYNYFTMFTAGSQASAVVFLHEFGHGFGGLADEYYGDASSALTASEYYKTGIEPYEPNVTALLEPENIKWGNLLTPGITIPTPWGQEELDSLDKKLYAVSRIARAVLDSLKQAGADQETVNKISSLWQSKRRKQFAISQERRLYWIQKLKDQVGVFEGAAHMSKGFYRPAMECLMNHMIEKEFCPICQKAFEDRIRYYTSVQ
jgi:hypothetical protein